MISRFGSSLLGLALWFSAVAQANQFALRPGYLETSDEFYFNTFHLTYDQELFDVHWPFASEKATGESIGVAVKGVNLDSVGGNRELQAGAVSFTEKFNSSFQASVNLGVVALDSEVPNNEAFQDFTYRLLAKSVVGQSLYLQFEMFKDYPIEKVLLFSGSAQQLKSYGLAPRVLYAAAERWRIQVQGEYRQLDDDQLRLHSDLQVMYGISPGEPWVWFGIGAEHLSYDRQDAEYWSPLNFRSVGPRFEAAKTIGNLVLSCGYNFSFFREDSFDPGERDFASASVAYGTRGGSRILIQYDRGASQQGDAIWTSESVMASLESGF